MKVEVFRLAELFYFPSSFCFFNFDELEFRANMYGDRYIKRERERWKDRKHTDTRLQHYLIKITKEKNIYYKCV